MWHEEYMGSKRRERSNKESIAAINVDRPFDPYCASCSPLLLGSYAAAHVAPSILGNDIEHGVARYLYLASQAEERRLKSRLRGAKTPSQRFQKSHDSKFSYQGGDKRKRRGIPSPFFSFSRI